MLSPFDYENKIVRVKIEHDEFELETGSKAKCILVQTYSTEGMYEMQFDFSDYEEDKLRRLGRDSLNPKRIHYKGLTR